MRIPRLLATSLLFALLAPAPVPAAASRIALLAEVQIQGSTILLANLLPPGVPSALHEAAANIALSPSPQIGAIRRFSANTISAAIQEAGLSVSAFVIPEFSTVRRSGRVLTREEVFSAVQTALFRANPAATLDLQPADLAFDSSIALPEGDARLTVTQFQFDRAIARARFRLQPHSSPSAPSFYVTVNLASAVIPARFALATLSTKPSNISRDRLAPKPAIIVDPSHPARLHLHSDVSDMLLDVRPLQRGFLGQVIRVRLRDSAKTFQARVVGANALDAAL